MDTETNNKAPNSGSPVEAVVKFKRVIQDDFVFVFKNSDLPLDAGRYRVFGYGDADRYYPSLVAAGYKPTATLSASLWLESLLAKDADGVVEMVDTIDS